MSISVMMKPFMLVAALLPLGLSCCNNVHDSVFAIGESDSCIDGLHAPWSHVDDDTKFRCHVSDGFLRFEFEVNDSTQTVVESFNDKMDVAREDRVEIFFSADSSMTEYYGMETDPEGRTMDYKAKYYRQFDYTWKFSTLMIDATRTENHYSVSGSIDMKELKSMGIDLKGGFYMGVFRADFRGDDVTWYSAVPTDDESPDFHKPDVLFRACVR